MKRAAEKGWEIKMRIEVNTDSRKAEMEDLFGIFFEDLNHAADGGLYAELVQNRSFEFLPIDNPSYHGLTAWEKIENDGEVSLSVEAEHGLFEKNPHYLVMEVLKPGSDVGVCNLGFNQGIYFQEGETYDFTCYARRREGECSGLNVSLRSSEGEIYSQQTISLTDKWEKYQLVFQTEKEDVKGRLAVTVEGRGSVELDFVSLFPRHTYKNRKNGLRKDLAELLEQMHPRFMRFPGGCLVHDGALHAEDRDSMYRWKNTVGPVENRPSCRNNWGYNQTMGLGFYEYFLFCEDIKAKPLPVLPGGYNPHSHEGASGELLQEFVQDALDLIEFANGGTDTYWGGLRASMGHPEPFGMEYLGIGNEEVGEGFFEREPLFHRAVREKYPQIKIIGTSGPFAAGENYDRGWQSARESGADLVDEHYYQSPEWFLIHHHRYDAFSKEGPKVFLGEYASHGNTWFNALCEASYMIGLQNAAHAVGLVCYAPLFCNMDYVNWEPDMIWYNAHQTVTTPSYHVQKLFMNHQGDVLLGQKASGTEEDVVWSRFPDRLSGAIMLEANESHTVFRDVVLTDEEGHVQYSCEKLELGPEKSTEILTSTMCKNYNIRLKACETSGMKGFIIHFGQQDMENRVFWGLGGWANEDSIIGEDNQGRNSCLIQKTRSVEVGRTYDLEIRVRGRKVETYVDGEKEMETEVLPVTVKKIYAGSSLEKSTGDVIVKLANVLPDTTTVEISLEGQEGCQWEGEEYKIDGNNYMAPEIAGRKAEKGVLAVTMEPESVHILRMRKSGTGESGSRKHNPVFEGLYADPDMIKYNGKYYLYPTTDGFANWSGTEFHVFSSEDRISWKDEGIILDVASEQVPWAVGSAWAPAIWERNGKFYYYFCAKRPDGTSCIGAAVSDSPVSGFCAQETPLLTPELVREEGVDMSQVIDPSVYEEDGDVYLLFGNGKGAVVKLTEDLLHICPGTMKNLEGLRDFREAVTVLKRQGLYHFTWSCDDTGDENYHVNYGISDSLYGPVTWKYPVLEKKPECDILGTGHHCILKEPGEDTYYMAYHRFATPTGNYPEGKGYHREVCIDAVEFGEDGLMKPVMVSR